MSHPVIARTRSTWAPKARAPCGPRTPTASADAGRSAHSGVRQRASWSPSPLIPPRSKPGEYVKCILQACQELQWPKSSLKESNPGWTRCLLDDCAACGASLSSNCCKAMRSSSQSRVWCSACRARARRVSYWKWYMVTLREPPVNIKLVVGKGAHVVGRDGYKPQPKTAPLYEFVELQTLLLRPDADADKMLLGCWGI